MSTKVFISWSGPTSQRLADALRRWLPSALQFVRPYFTPEDVEKGAKWASEISKELEMSNVGIICLTHDNTEKPWIIFEAGALSKSLDKGRVCPLLFELEPAEVKGPLTSFQGTRFNREDFKRLLTVINAAGGDSRLEPGVLDSVFEMWWPKLELEVSDILRSSKNVPAKHRRPERDILEEILELTRMSAHRNLRRMPERSLYELVEALDELEFLARHENSELAQRLWRKLERPIRNLCLDANLPDVYERFRSRSRNAEQRTAPPAVEVEIVPVQPEVAPPRKTIRRRS